jgi:uncharacterized protein
MTSPQTPSLEPRSPVTPLQPMVPGTPPTDRRWLEGAVFLGLATALVAVVSVPLGLGLFDESTTSSVVLLSQFTPLAASVATWQVFGRRQRLRDLWALRVPRRGAMLSGFGWALAAVLLVAAAQALSHLAMVAALGQPIGFASGQLGLAPAVLPLVLALTLPCFGEEVGWRGHLWQVMAGLAPWPRVVLTSGVWALWHLALMVAGVTSGALDTRQAAVSVIDVFFVGLLIGWLRERSGTVWPAVLAHALINSGLVYLTALMTPPSEQATWPLWRVVVFTGVGAIAWWLVSRRVASRVHGVRVHGSVRP